jgi:hypothetical protein
MESSIGKRMKKPVKQIRKINTSSMMFTPVGAPSTEAIAALEKKQKGRPRTKGKGLRIDTSSLVISPPEPEQESAVLPTSVSVEPAKKPLKLKKLNIDSSKLPLFGVNVAPSPAQAPLSKLPKLAKLPQFQKKKQFLSDEPGLSDIIEAPEEEEEEL